jgi:hypothetical protein
LTLPKIENHTKKSSIIRLSQNRIKLTSILCTNCATFYAFVRCIDWEESFFQSCNTAHSIIKKFQELKIESLVTNLVDWAENEINLKILTNVWATTQAINYHSNEQGAAIVDKMNIQMNTTRATTEAVQQYFAEKRLPTKFKICNKTSSRVVHGF